MIWILLPAYNEEESIPKLLPKIKESFANANIDFKLVVVNDGSFDNTSILLEKFKDSLPITILTHEINRGLGETERDGFEYIAKNGNAEDICVRIEGDDTHDPKYAFDLINKVKEGYDVVNTSRFQPGGGQEGLDAYRTWLSKAANRFMKFMFGIKGIKDYSCGYRAYRVEVLQHALQIFGNNFIQLRGLGFTGTLEIIVKLNLLGCKFAEVPFVLRYDLKESASKMVGSITTLGYFTMALLYHWPWGGWKRNYKNLKKQYPKNPEQAVDNYKQNGWKLQSVSKISL